MRDLSMYVFFGLPLLLGVAIARAKLFADLKFKGLLLACLGCFAISVSVFFATARTSSETFGLAVIGLVIFGIPIQLVFTGIGFLVANFLLPKRSIRFNLATAIVMMLLAGGLLAINFRSRVSHAQAIDERELYRYEQGWPTCWREREIIITGGKIEPERIEIIQNQGWRVEETVDAETGIRVEPGKTLIVLDKIYRDGIVEDAVYAAGILLIVGMVFQAWMSFVYNSASGGTFPPSPNQQQSTTAPASSLGENP